MNIKQATTFSLLAHVRSSGTLIKDLMDVFVPLVKKALSLMSEEGRHEGKNISEIREKIEEVFDIDFPIPVLKIILNKIITSVNSDENVKFVVYGDNAFSINQYLFTDFDGEITKGKEQIVQLEKAFKDFCNVNNIELEDFKSIFDFIGKNKILLSKYLAYDNKEIEKIDFSNEARFVDYFRKIPSIYNTIKNIYLGSIISTYIEYRTESIKTDIELLFDTNFIISLLDLNTPESTHTCKKLIEIAVSQGFKLSILIDTIEEIRSLILNRARFFNKSFLLSKVNTEDIYNACDRKKFKASDLERIADNLETLISENEIEIIGNTIKYQRQARGTHEFQYLKTIRNSELAALHDATAICYVRDKRKTRIKEFENVNCWFVNNSISYKAYINNNYTSLGNEFYQQESIKVDDLVNILWLTNPGIGRVIDDDEFADIGITTLISITMRENLPKSSIIRELDDNIQKYATDIEKINDRDIVRIATRISHNQLTNIEALNSLATRDPIKFVERIKEEADLQKEEDETRTKKLDAVFERMNQAVDRLTDVRELYKTKTTDVDKERESFKEIIEENNAKLEKVANDLKIERLLKLREKNENSNLKRAEYKRKQIKKWRWNFWKNIFYFILLCTLISTGVFFGFYLVNDYNIERTEQALLEIEQGRAYSLLKWIFSGVVLVILGHSINTKFINPSTIKTFTDSIVYPKEMIEIPEDTLN